MDEMIDAGLQGIGVRFEDMTKAQPKKKKKTAPAVKDKPVDASWAPVKEVTTLDRVRDMALGSMTPGGLSLFFWWCQVTGRMDAKTAVSAMLVCVAVAAFRMGMAVSK